MEEPKVMVDWALVEETRRAVYSNSALPEESYETIMLWRPDLNIFDPETLKKLHSLAVNHGMNHSNVVSIEQILKQRNNVDSSAVTYFMDDLLNYLKPLNDEMTGLRFHDSENLPYHVQDLKVFRKSLPAGTSLTKDQELSFLLILLFAPWYERNKHYPEFHRFIQQRGVDDARTALHLLAEGTVKRLSEAEHIIDGKKVPLAQGAL